MFYIYLMPDSMIKSYCRIPCFFVSNSALFLHSTLIRSILHIRGLGTYYLKCPLLIGWEHHVMLIVQRGNARGVIFRSVRRQSWLTNGSLITLTLLFGPKSSCLHKDHTVWERVVIMIIAWFCFDAGISSLFQCIRRLLWQILTCQPPSAMKSSW